MDTINTNVNMSSIEKIDYSTETSKPEATTVDVYDIVVVLDESGSMISIGLEAQDCINNFFNEQKAMNIAGSKATLVKFNMTTNEVFSDIPLKDVPIFDSFRPNSMTALYDAIGKTIIKKKLGSNKVIFVILTDGEENCSKEFTDGNMIKEMINDMQTNHGWKFVYLAANQDAFTVGAKYGINNCGNFDATPLGFVKMTREISTGISRMRSGDSKEIEIETKHSEDINSVDIEPTSLPPLIPMTPINTPRMRRHSIPSIPLMPPESRQSFIRDTGVDVDVIKDEFIPLM
jgi:hypothetical protein